MVNPKIKLAGHWVVLPGLLIAAVMMQSCGSNKQTAPPGATGSSAGTGTGAGAGAGGSSSAGKSGSTGGDNTSMGGAAGETGAGTGGGGTGGTGGTVNNSTDCGPGCTSPTGCCTCPPQSNFQFLNACVGDGICALSYDNSQVQKLVDNGGKVPPLP